MGDRGGVKGRYNSPGIPVDRERWEGYRWMGRCFFCRKDTSDMENGDENRYIGGLMGSVGISETQSQRRIYDKRDN